MQQRSRFNLEEHLSQLKIKSFEPSDPFPHGAEWTSTTRSHYSTDTASLDEEILLMFIDGGGDHVTQTFLPKYPWYAFSSN